MNNLQQRIENLFNAKDGLTAHDALKVLWPHDREPSSSVREALIRYAKTGNVAGVRTHIAARLSDIASVNTSDLAELFQAGLHEEALRYWSIKGASAALDKRVYPDLSKIALDETIPLADRAHAIQVLARLSQQPFFRGALGEPGHWKAEDLRIDDIKVWQDHGCPDGAGCPPPLVDLALQAPRSAIEKAAAKLEAKLLKIRKNDQDNSLNPRNYLCPGSLSCIELIEKQFHLPKNYREFLARFSPYNITTYFYVPGIKSNFSFYTAESLLASQSTFSLQGDVPNPYWPPNCIAIGDAWMNPVIMDLSRGDSEDAPLLWADHDEFPMMFRPCASSFTAFLERLKVTDQWRDETKDLFNDVLFHITTLGRHLNEPE